MKLTTAKRKAMPAGMFAGGKKKGTKGAYPIPDANHARDALSRVSANGSPAMKAKVKTAVKKKFPGIKVGKQGRKATRPKVGAAALKYNITKKPGY